MNPNVKRRVEDISLTKMKNNGMYYSQNNKGKFVF